MGRATCYRCDKPQVACICETLREVSNHTPVWVIQHPRERRHPLGTARIARLGLGRVEVMVTPGGHDAPPLPPGAGLLYPGGKELAPDDELGALVVIDGTWPQARSLYRRCPWLQALPRYALTPRQQSRYRLRKEPAPHCVSTIEAIVEALRRVEPHTPGLPGLLDAFDAMIDRQIELSERGLGPRPARDWRHSFTSEKHRLIAIDLDIGPIDDGPLVVLHMVAWRWADGATFEAFVQPDARRRPHVCHLAHLELDGTRLDGGLSEAELHARWMAFCQPGDLIAAWSAKTLRALAEAGLWRGPTITLKSAFRQAHPQVRGPIETVLQGAGQLGIDLGLHGRTGRQLGAVAALLEAPSSTHQTTGPYDSPTDWHG